MIYLLVFIIDALIIGADLSLSYCMMREDFGIVPKLMFLASLAILILIIALLCVYVPKYIGVLY